MRLIPLLILLLITLSCETSHDSDVIFKNFERQSKITLPKSLMNKDSGDDGGGPIVGFATIDPKDLQALLSKHKFKKYNEKSFTLYGARRFEKPHPLKKNSELYHLNGMRTKKHSWVLYLDKANNELWFVIEYNAWHE